MILLAILFILNAEVNNSAIEKSLLQEIPSTLKLNEILEIKPIAGHVINPEAPNSCGFKGNLVELKKEALYCQVTHPGDDSFNVYICDEAKTFCKQQSLKIRTESPQGIKSWMKFYWNNFFSKSHWSSPSKVAKSPNSAAKNFFHNEIGKAFDLAKSSEKPVLVYYTQKYCPPCKLVKEASLSSNDFQDFAKKFVLLQVDADLDSEDGFIKKHNLLYTPTFVFFNSQGQELGRKVDFLSPDGFKKIWSDIENTQPVSELEKKTFSDLSHDEKIRLYNWYMESHRLKEAKELYLSHEEGFRRSNELVPLFWLKDKMSFDEKNKYLTKILAQKEISCSSLQLSDGQGLIDDLMDKKDLSESERMIVELSYKKISNLLAQKILEKPSDITCYARQFFSNLSYFNYLQNKTEPDLKLIETESIRLNQMLDHFPKLAGSSLKESIALYKTYSMPKLVKFKSMEKLSIENRDDFSYDYLSALHDYNEANPNYARALNTVEKVLAKGKGRIWEKATKLKIQILIKMKKNKEAESLIQETLTLLDLPRNEKMMIHKFVQNLRELQRELNSIQNLESKS